MFLFLIFIFSKYLNEKRRYIALIERKHFPDQRRRGGDFDVKLPVKNILGK